jgi:hypothetical protein
VVWSLRGRGRQASKWLRLRRRTKAGSKERRTVRVDFDTLAVYPETGHRNSFNRIGTVVEYVVNHGARIRTKRSTSGPFTSRRLTARLNGDDRKWVGQMKKDETEKVILRPLGNGNGDTDDNGEDTVSV